MIEEIEKFAVKFNRTMEDYAIAGIISADDAIYDLWNYWEKRILPILPVQSSTGSAKQ